MFVSLKDILTNTESVSLFSQANLENSMKRGRADIFSRHIIRGMGVGLLLISSSRYSRTCLLNWASVPRFPILEYDYLLHRHWEGGTKTFY